MLFGKLGLPTEGLKKTQAGGYSTAADVLEGLRGRHEIVDLILEQRQLSKLLSTYVDALPGLVNPRTGRLHTSFNQTGAETGRLSSSNPNLQNIPIRTDVGGRSAGRSWPSGLACCSRPTTRRWSCASWRTSPATSTCWPRSRAARTSTPARRRRSTACRLSQVTKEQRAVAKMMNFATSYGVTAFGLAQRTGLSRTEADQFMQRYFATYPGVKRYIDETKQLAREQGYVETLLGRRRYFPVLQDAGHRPAGLQHPPGRRARGHQPPHPGHRGRHHQDRDDPAAPGADRRRLSRPHDPAGARRAGAGSAATTS